VDKKVRTLLTNRLSLFGERQRSLYEMYQEKTELLLFMYKSDSDKVKLDDTQLSHPTFLQGTVAHEILIERYLEAIQYW